MSEVLTTKQFKATHQLSDSAFQRLVKKICEVSMLPRQELICPISSTEHQILKPELFESAVQNRKPQSKRIKPVSVHTEDVAIIADLVEEVTAIAIANPLDSYSPLTACQPQTWNYTDTSEIVEAGKNALDNIILNSANNQNLGIAALLEHERNEGAKLGIALAQVRLGTATQMKDEVISDYLKKFGLSSQAAL